MHRYLAARPLVTEAPEGFLSRTRPMWPVVGAKGSQVRYNAFAGRGDWKSAPDMRPSRREALVEAVLSRCGV